LSKPLGPENTIGRAYDTRISGATTNQHRAGVFKCESTMSSETERIEREALARSNRDGALEVPSEVKGLGAVKRVVNVGQPSVAISTESAASVTRATTGKRWRWLAGASAVLLTALTLTAIYLVTRKPSTVDQVIILTVPSGADIRLDSKDYGHSPVKLERLAIGNYVLTITKDGFEPIEQTINVNEAGPLEFKLKPVVPSEVVGLPAEEQIKRYQQRSEEALARGNYGLVYEGSALNFAELIEYSDPGNAFAVEMRERVRKAAHQAAQIAVARGDLAQGQEVYKFLVEFFPFDEEARAAAAKLESQLAARRGKIGELVRKAEEAYQAGRLTEPLNESAYYYSKQALAIDRQNEKARQIRTQVKEAMAAQGEQASGRGDADAAYKQFDQAAQLFPEDKQLRTRARELQAVRANEQAKASDPNTYRLRGLEEARKENFADAIHDLEIAVINGRGTPDVLYALARSYMRTNQLDQAESYFRKLQITDGEHYRSALASLGDIASLRGDTATAVERWKEARQLGGSTVYTVAILDDKIERVERVKREKAAEPQPLTIQVRHVHGGLLGGTCGGPLSVSSTGVTYEGKEHQYSYNVAGVGVGVAKDEMTIRFGKDSQRFKVARTDAERFRETVNRYQNR
jgi:tetratricopeptide (TPR) repeat protein